MRARPVLFLTLVLLASCTGGGGFSPAPSASVPSILG
jgi:hypothetical protein